MTGIALRGRQFVDIERFVKEQDIQRYRRLLDFVSEETQRRQIINLLKHEETLLEEEKEKRKPNWVRPDRPATA
jgi:hypothetical protein